MDEPVVVHAQPGIPWQKRYLEAITDGLATCGIGAKWTSQQETGPGTHIILGPNAFRQAFERLRSEGRDLLTINRAFIGSVLGDERNPYVAIGWNGYNNLARFPFKYGEVLPHSRMGSLWGQVRGFRQAPTLDGQVALVLGEYDTPADYLTTALGELHEAGEAFYYRPHPQAQKPKGVRLAPWPTIEEAIDESAYVLTHHSTAGVTALIRGCAVVTYDQESMAWPITSHSIDELRYPNRELWLEWLAWTQWTIEEIARGDPWEFFV